MSSDEINKDKALELLERIKNKDERAMTQFHRLFNKRLYAFALNRLGNGSDADSVVSDTLFNVWNKPDEFKGESSLSTWLHGIANNKVKDYHKKNKRYWDATNSDDLAETLVSDWLSPEEAFAMIQDDAQYRLCLDKLPPAQKECLRLSSEEFKNVAEGTVKSRLHHARENLKKCLQGSSKSSINH
jgi:RNA polymerase sigma-70 factor, ECF subfamily